jgi:hypothetical protein
MDYRELPTLNVTFPQACRLWQVESGECTRALERLIAEGFLGRNDGKYVRRPATNVRMSRPSQQRRAR